MTSRIVVALMVVVLWASCWAAPAQAGDRWVYIGTNSGVSFYVDTVTICRTKGGDLSLFVRAVSDQNTTQERLVIDVDNRNYCYPDTGDYDWKAIPPDSILEDLWSVAYRAEHSESRYASN